MNRRVVSCDEIGIAKVNCLKASCPGSDLPSTQPDPRIYEHCKKRVGFAETANVFVAAHTWDLGPAKDVG